MEDRIFKGGNYRNRENSVKLPQWAIDAQNRPYAPPTEPPSRFLNQANFEGRNSANKLPQWAIDAKNAENQRMIEEGLYSKMTPQEQMDYFETEQLPIDWYNAKYSHNQELHDVAFPSTFKSSSMNQFQKEFEYRSALGVAEQKGRNSRYLIDGYL